MKLMINEHCCVHMNGCVEISGSFFKEWEDYLNYWKQIHNMVRSDTNLILLWNTVFLLHLIHPHASLHFYYPYPLSLLALPYFLLYAHVYSHVKTCI